MTTSTSLAIIPRSLDEVTTLADVFSKSGLLPEALRGKTPDIVVSILAGQELGLPPMASIRGVHVVQGKPVIAADTMVGLVLASGLAEYFVQVEASNTTVTYETKRKGAPIPQRCTWTIEDAKRAGLHQKDNWRLHPRQMLASRAKAELARVAFPDVLAGIYDPDEIAVPVQPMAPVERAPAPKYDDVQDAELVDETPPQFTMIDATQSSTELQSLAPDFAKLKGAVKKRVGEYYSAKLAAHRAAEDAANTKPMTNGVHAEPTA